MRVAQQSLCEYCRSWPSQKCIVPASCVWSRFEKSSSVYEWLQVAIMIIIYRSEPGHRTRVVDRRAGGTQKDNIRRLQRPMTSIESSFLQCIHVTCRLILTVGYLHRRYIEATCKLLRVDSITTRKLSSALVNVQVTRTESTLTVWMSKLWMLPNLIMEFALQRAPLFTDCRYLIAHWSQQPRPTCCINWRCIRTYRCGWSD